MVWRCLSIHDILLYEFCYYYPMDLLHHLEKGKEESPPLQYHIKSLQYHIKTLQEFAKKSNIPWIWRIICGHKLPYMKKTRKKKQVCGAACFMAAWKNSSSHVYNPVHINSIRNHLASGVFASSLEALVLSLLFQIYSQNCVEIFVDQTIQLMWIHV